MNFLRVILVFLAATAAAANVDTEETPKMSVIPKTKGRRLGFLSNSVCRGVRAANPGSLCICTGERLWRNRNTPLTVQCTNTKGWIVPFVGTFTSKYNGEFYLFNDAKPSTSKLCLSEISGKYDVACIQGEHCQGKFDCYNSCSANVGGEACNSCNVCPNKTGAIVDCTNLIPYLKWSDCDGKDPVVAPAAGPVATPAAPVTSPV
jgi:hypothetical protein